MTRPSEPCASQVFLVFGKTGWIGGLVGELLEQRGARFEYAQARLEDRAGVLADVERVRPQGLCRRRIIVPLKHHHLP